MYAVEVDGVAEVGDGNDSVTDDGFVHSTTSASESTNDFGLLSVGGSSIFATPLLQSVKPRLYLQAFFCVWKKCVYCFSTNIGLYLMCWFCQKGVSE